MEMLLVVAILMVMVSMVFPSIMRMYADHGLKTAVEEVRVKLARTRYLALDSGTIFQFRFEPGGQHYIVLPYELTAQEEESEMTLFGSAPSESYFFGQIPEDMQFESVSDSTFGAERLSEDWLSGFSDKRSIEEITWSPPLLFFADGSAVDALFNIYDEQNQYQAISLRGLTGAVNVDRVRMRPRT